LIEARSRIYLLALAAAARLPLGNAYDIARRLGRLRHRLARRSLHVNEAVVRALQPTPEQIDRWALQASELRASSDLEAYLYPRLGREGVDRVVRVQGLENLDSALEAGRGAVLYSAHIWGTHPFFAALGRLGYSPVVVGYPPDFLFLPVDRRFIWRLAELLEQTYGCQYLWMKPGNFDVAVKAVNAARQNRVVVMLVDMPHRRNSTEVDWLGGRAEFSLGPALIAKAAGAPLLDFFVHRDEQWLPQVAEIGPPVPVTGTVEEAVQRCASRLEEHLRLHPAQWHFFSNYDDTVVVVRSGGHRIQLGRIEAALSSHPGIREAVAVAVPDEALGNRIKAVVVPAVPGALDAEAVLKHCTGRLPAYMVPEEVELVSALPPTLAAGTR
jgi:lauroyl/myristoyl acyltransferase